jgi:hypothetical protein
MIPDRERHVRRGCGRVHFHSVMAVRMENKALEYLREKGKSVFIHSVITGGQSLNDTGST